MFNIHHYLKKTVQSKFSTLIRNNKNIRGRTNILKLNSNKNGVNYL